MRSRRGQRDADGAVAALAQGGAGGPCQAARAENVHGAQGTIPIPAAHDDRTISRQRSSRTLPRSRHWGRRDPGPRGGIVALDRADDAFVIEASEDVDRIFCRDGTCAFARLAQRGKGAPAQAVQALRRCERVMPVPTADDNDTAVEEDSTCILARRLHVLDGPRQACPHVDCLDRREDFSVPPAGHDDFVAEGRGSRAAPRPALHRLHVPARAVRRGLDRCCMATPRPATDDVDALARGCACCPAPALSKGTVGLPHAGIGPIIDKHVNLTAWMQWIAVLAKNESLHCEDAVASRMSETW
eukprot:m.112943 g.112943  ORF g.112943 m.112943 type:complete len:301 (+) comp9123_c0_seq4:87-989(+)